MLRTSRLAKTMRMMVAGKGILIIDGIDRVWMNLAMTSVTVRAMLSTSQVVINIHFGARRASTLLWM